MKQSIPVIAHRGACGYAPEHTLAAVAMAHVMGADFIEQDVILTRDDQTIVFHDLWLELVTDVARVFPGRARSDGRFYAIDFTLEELKSLRVFERRDPATDKTFFSSRFPETDAGLTIPTLAESVRFIKGLNRSRNRSVGLYTELKCPAFHHKEGKDLAAIVLEELAGLGYNDPLDGCIVMSFDPHELSRIRMGLGSRLPLVQLVHEGESLSCHCDYEKMLTPRGLEKIKRYADSLGPTLVQLVGDDGGGNPRFTGLDVLCRDQDLALVPHVFRTEAIPTWAQDMDGLLSLFVNELSIEAVNTDQPDLAVSFLARNRPF